MASKVKKTGAAAASSTDAPVTTQGSSATNQSQLSVTLGQNNRPDRQPQDTQSNG